ncbi:DUF4397 domain-containing protein [Mycobacterium sp. MYCO198283]|uniref:DUF4397 domain-containing protein n=1 Tax=Mycobacterium sp. MYCO198283 TaxID=2883505 RepID=UPI001E4A07EB|nr:DUF4397 domain-containing protein [Mycobacterium sp. MYCO198283]MCG5431007.1 DUF4397 domain-containing protein [Mycobacterium sp. MYCO198283]
MRHQLRRSAASVVGCAALLTISVAPAAATPAAGATASVRGAHFSPDTPSVDVYLTSFSGGTTTLALSDVGYGDVSDYQSLQPGQYTIGMRPAGADPSTPPAITWTLDAKPGGAYTALAIGMNKSLEGRVLADDLTPPPAGQARVRVVQAAASAPKADIAAAGGPTFATALPFTTTTDYTSVPAGSWPVTATPSGATQPAATATVTLQAGQVNTMVLLDSPQTGLVLRTLPDAVGASAPPSGPVDAGGGAMAGASHPVLFGVTALTVALAVALTAAAVRRTARP